MVEAKDPNITTLAKVTEAVDAIRQQDPQSDVWAFSSQPQDFKIDPQQDSS